MWGCWRDYPSSEGAMTMANMSNIQTVWVFNGARSNFPSAVFSQRELGEQWIKKNLLTGTLTRYPVDVSAYDWAISKGLFTVSKDEQREATFIQKFSSASQEHYHYEDGLPQGLQ
jgi:hypothetical protein